MRNLRIFRSKDNQWQFKVVDKEKMLFIGETYPTKRIRNVGINSLRKNSQLPEQYTRKTVTKGTRNKGKKYFTIKAKNNEPLGCSKLFKTEELMEKGIKTLMKLLQS